MQVERLNLETNEKVTLKEVLEDRDIDETVVENRIKTVVQNSINDSNNFVILNIVFSFLHLLF